MDCIEANPEWQGNQLSFVLKERKTGVVVIFEHFDRKSDQGMFGSVNYTWGRYLASLKNYIETGKGEPNTV